MLDIITLGVPTSGNVFVQIIKWLVGISGSVAVGIILFTVLLKLVTFPFDLISRISMKKNSIKMEAMRPELEKLQKQYANNKELYNQKMAALYKKNGYSMMGACLPMIASIVIFIVAINGFTAYGKYQNSQYFYDMAKEYNQVVFSSFEIDNNYIQVDENGNLIFNDAEIYKDGVAGSIKGDYEFAFDYNTETKKGIIKFNSKNGYVYYQKGYTKTDSVAFEEGRSFYLLEGSLVNNETLKLNEKTYSEFNADNPISEKDFITQIRQEKAAETFKTENGRFLWVKNIWVKDSATAHPVNSDVESFVSEQGYEINAQDYENLTAKLEWEKSAPNGYYILCVLTAGISFLMQFVTNKTQKAQMDLQTVDGAGAGNKKMMMIMMPIMMAVFSFLYTAAFSIYIIISSVISILTTILINAIVQRVYNKKQEASETNVTRSRIYIAKEEPKEEPKPKKEKKAKKVKKADKEPVGDFLTGPVQEKKHVRGRLK